MQVAERDADGPWHGHGGHPDQPSQPSIWTMIRTDLRPALIVVVAAAATGVPLGWLWSRIAPPQRRVVAEDGNRFLLQGESYHRFDDLVLFALLGLGAGLVIGGAAWSLRACRGPVIMLAAVLGSGIAAWLAMRIGLSVVDSHYATQGQPAARDIVEQAPMLESAWVVIAQPLMAALGYGIPAAWNGTDDLGRAA